MTRPTKIILDGFSTELEEAFDRKLAAECGDDQVEACSECGHLHWRPAVRQYEACPIEGCPCPNLS